jgi:putative ABC transport system substrate-binding protein
VVLSLGEDYLKRRDFITLVGGAAAWPVAARAQQPALPVIGFLCSGSPNAYAPFLTALRQGLNDAGYVEHRNVGIEYRWAEGQYDRLPALASDLVASRVAVIVAAGGAGPALAAKAATTTIPIVFISGADPVKSGLVESFNRPGGNVTGVYLFLTGLEAKKLGLLRQLVPQADVIAVLLNSARPDTDAQLKDIQEAARAVGLQINILQASSERDFAAAFASIAQLRVGALLVGADPFFTNQRDQIVALTARYAIPAIYELREYAAAGGLMSYGTSLADGYRQAGIYAGRALKGDKPADMPVVQSTKFEFVINLKTAKALSLAIPPGVLAIADEVIE